MEDLETSLKSIKSTGAQWWEDALSCIQKKAASHQREHKNKKQSVELQALRFLRGSTRDSIAPAVYQFLSSLGIAATDAATAYTLPLGVYEKAQRDRTGMETLSKLKGVITTGETSGDLRQQRNEWYRLMRELQERKKLQQLVPRIGSAIRGAKAVAKELVDHWDKMSTPAGSTEEDCVAYLKSLGVEQRLRKAGRLLCKQISPDIVHEGLKRLNSNSSPGLDGFSAKFFKRFSGIFEPQMYDSLKRFLDVGKMPETWTSGVVTMIPKTKAMQTTDSLRPIALQNTRQKWLTNILLIQLEDVLLHCIPSQQTGFHRHRSILQHVYGSRALWDGLREGAALSVDFRNAFPTMSHEMVSVALGLMCIPFLSIRLILHLLRAPYLYSVGKGYVPGVYHHPRAGTRQGDPLSPALFSLVASFVIFPLQDLGSGLAIMMYADDLIIFLDGRANPKLLKRVWEVVSRFEYWEHSNPCTCGHGPPPPPQQSQPPHPSSAPEPACDRLVKEEMAASEESPPPSPAKLRGAQPQPQEAGTIQVGSMGYADDTYPLRSEGQYMAPVMQLTDEWLALTLQKVNPKKSLSIQVRQSKETARKHTVLQGISLPLQAEFRSLGVDIRTNLTRGTGPLLKKRTSKGKHLLSRVRGAQGGFSRRTHIIATLVQAAALWGTPGAEVSRRDLQSLETAVLHSLRGTSRRQGEGDHLRAASTGTPSVSIH